MKRPEIRVPVPGPNAQKIVERDTRALMTTTKTAPVVAKDAKGCWIEDVDGNTFLDFTSGVGVVNAGHCHPKIVEALRDQAGKFMHIAGTDYYYAPQVDLAEKLAEVTPGSHAKKVFYTNSGAESLEAAIKLARFSTERTQFIAFYNAFHGRTMGALSLTASKPVHKGKFFPTVPGVHHAHYANPYRNPFGIDGYDQPEELVNRCIDYIESTLFTTVLPADEVAAIFVEPLQGEGGYIVPPKSFFPALRKLCDENGILLVADEVQSGFGRTGKMFCVDHYDTVPDVMTLAKGIASGFPIGACVARADLDFTVSGAHSNTYGGNPMGCRAALANLEVIQDERLIENADKQGTHMRKRLREFQAKWPDHIGDVRGLGLMVATDHVKSAKTRDFDAKSRNRLAEEAFKRGLMLLPCGKSSMRYIPPLTVTTDELDAGLDVIEECLKVIYA